MSEYFMSIDGKFKRINRFRYRRILRKIEQENIPYRERIMDDGLVLHTIFEDKGKTIMLIDSSF
ncbi:MULTISPECIES: hypothetical protein [Actinomycetaceae]|uniref:Uncharacterized protein n=1 Tax=Schaalia turicensis TaxID=131111 RepID=A0A2I1I4C3_9ACTO|nr:MULTISPECIES: hypothetical protein [Actinomycetaceae]MDK6399469.1 hypothetical protein [Pauljensenia sp. UMB9872]MDK7172284.1 hypothetical protein [Pauljensenia sp. UMB1235]PKY65977.1 hypothetical protein CYJ25_06455 [Schaalia turicensis]